MATNPFQSFISGLQAPAYSGLNLSSYANKNKQPMKIGGMDKPTPEQLASFKTNTNGATQPTPTKITPPTSDPGSYRGVAITPGNDQSVASQVAGIDSSFSPKNQYLSNVISSSGIGTNPPTPAGQTGSGRTLKKPEPRTTTAPKTSYDIAMDAYISALEGSQNINNQLQEQTLAGNRAYQGALDQTGGLLTGNQQAAAATARRTNASLADLGIAQNSATSAANLALQRLMFEKELLPSQDPYTLSAGQTRFDAQGNPIASVSEGGGDGFTLSEGQVRYALNPETGQYEAVGNNAPQGASYGPNSPEITAWAQIVQKDPARIANVPEELRTQVAQALQALPTSQNPEVQNALQDAAIVLGGNGQTGILDEALGLINGGTAGLAANIPAIKGTSAFDLEKALDTIKAKLGFQALAAMRAASPTGGALGSITERELQFLQSTVASLERGQKPETLRKNIEKVREHYQNWVELVTQANQGSSYGGDTGGGGSIWNF